MVQPPSRSENNAQPPKADVIQAILKGIRVPDLPYPVTRPDDNAVADWIPLLHSCWRDQLDSRVIDVLAGESETWSVRQVNAAYLADRIMDVFLQTSGLHATLVRRTARLRFLLAWQIAENGADAISSSSPVHRWLENLGELRGWSDSGGRAARQLLGWLDRLVEVGLECFETRALTAFESFTAEWDKAQAQKDGRIGRLRQRLLETEQGAARQRSAEQVARALVGRAMGSRDLPPAITSFVDNYWLPLLRQVVWSEGVASDNARHGAKLLEWMIWVADPKLSDQERDKLYRVGEQLSDKITEVWARVNPEPIPAGALQGVEEVMVARLRGTPVELEPVARYEHDPRWLNPASIAGDDIEQWRGSWFVEGHGEQEQRLFFFAFLEESQDVLWTNGEGVKLGLMAWSDFTRALDQSELSPLAAINPFANVVGDTLQKLEQVLRAQVAKRKEARAKAEAQAAKVRAERVAAEQRRQEEQARIAAEEAEAQAARDAEALAIKEAELARLAHERLTAAKQQVENLKLGSWIASIPAPDAEPAEARKLKLAVRLNATGKLVFVDRLGLNRTEMTVDSLVDDIVQGRARVMSSEAEFEDTLSRVVGRIRVGR